MALYKLDEKHTWNGRFISRMYRDLKLNCFRVFNNDPAWVLLDEPLLYIEEYGLAATGDRQAVFLRGDDYVLVSFNHLKLWEK